MDIREATPADAPAITRFLQRAEYSHFHADWRMPIDWIGTPGFLVGEEKNHLSACFTVVADPPPAAWVRVAAFDRWTRPDEALRRFIPQVLPYLLDQGVRELAWLLVREWPAPLLPGLGFGKEPVNFVETYVRDDAALPPPSAAREDLVLRPVLQRDIGDLVAIEEAAFEPMWRHSADSLIAAWEEALTFDVALLADRPVAFQYSSRSREGAHLARITVDPQWQGHGIGSALLRHTLVGYRRHGIRYVSLNTQADNVASQHLYRRFGFRPIGYRLPVWRRFLAP